MKARLIKPRTNEARYFRKSYVSHTFRFKKCDGAFGGSKVLWSQGYRKTKY
jgi:hypothetical protein